MAVTTVLLAGVVGGVALVRSGGHGPVVSACTVSDASGSVYQLTPDQGQNAAIIAAVAFKMGLPDHAVTVALATALQESGLVNIPYGDLDSVGLFQQRPSQGWGARTQLLDPVYAATAFYSHLTQVPGWSTMAVTDAAAGRPAQRGAERLRAMGTRSPGPGHRAHRGSARRVHVQAGRLRRCGSVPVRPGCRGEQ